jgi:hypothetical protein
LRDLSKLYPVLGKMNLEERLLETFTKAWVRKVQRSVTSTLRNEIEGRSPVGFCFTISVEGVARKKKTDLR